tara:strand:- start:3531 stop:4004 length:474 start_codon:yes stop_codon:yes gene_type:complete
MKRTPFARKASKPLQRKQMQRVPFISQGKPMRAKSKRIPQKSAKQISYEASPDGIEDKRQRKLRRMVPCIICEMFGEAQLSPTTCHHWIMGRVGTRRTPCKQSLPLCDGHHQGDFDTSKIAIHREPDAWREAYGLDTDYIKEAQRMIDNLCDMELDY